MIIKMNFYLNNIITFNLKKFYSNINSVINLIKASLTKYMNTS